MPLLGLQLGRVDGLVGTLTGLTGSGLTRGISRTASGKWRTPGSGNW